jgi:SAM-dependent methyltransferase
MKEWLMDLLACPACEGDKPLTLSDAAREGAEIVSGAFGCASCGASWRIERGVPRFVPEADDYAGNFGYQWDRWRTVQIDRLNGTTLTEDRMLRDTGWPRDWFPGKTILDAGCGAGRFADVLAGLGARVVAVDLSRAVDACAATTADRGDAVSVIQASIYDLPLKKGAFDGVHCAGVIQHTPDPARTMRAMPPLLKPGGRLGYNFYEAGGSRNWQLVKYAMRRFTPAMRSDRLVALCRALTAVFFPVTWALSHVRFVRYINRFFPVCASHDPVLSYAQQYTWTLLDTFDWYSPRFEIAQNHREVGALLADAGLTAIETDDGIARGTMPE